MKNEQMVGVRLPGALVKELEKIESFEESDRSTTVRKLLSRAVQEWKLEHYAMAYGRGKFSLARAAHEADVSVWEMMAYLLSHKIAAQYDADDLRGDMARIRARRTRAATSPSRTANRNRK
jgi:predicted HTH domain antitoxin